MSEVRAGSPETQQRESIAPLDELLLASLAALAAAGGVEQACRLAGRACALHRGKDEAAWHRYNVLLHRLAGKAAGAPRD